MTHRFLVGVFLSLLVVPFAAGAAAPAANPASSNIEELRALVAELQAQIATLQEQIRQINSVSSPTQQTQQAAGSASVDAPVPIPSSSSAGVSVTASTSVPTPVPVPVVSVAVPAQTPVLPPIRQGLRRGYGGADVRTLQRFLAQFPDIYPDGTVSGYFGIKTEEAVRRFQEKNGLETVGSIGPQTAAAMNRVRLEASRPVYALPAVPTASGSGKTAAVPPPAPLPPIGSVVTGSAVTSTPASVLAATGTPALVLTATTSPTVSPVIPPTQTDGAGVPAAPSGNPSSPSAGGATVVPAVPAVPAQPAQPSGQTGTTTVPAVPAQPAQPTTPVTTPSTPPTSTAPAVPAVPAQPTGQTGTTTVPATPAQPAVPVSTSQPLLAPANLVIDKGTTLAANPPGVSYSARFDYAPTSETKQFHVYLKKPQGATITYTFDAQVPLLDPSAWTESQTSPFLRRTGASSWYFWPADELLPTADPSRLGEYTISVAAVNDAGSEGAMSTVKSIRIYAPPVISAPANGATTAGKPVITFASGDSSIPNQYFAAYVYKANGSVAWSSGAASPSFTYPGNDLSPNDNPHRLVVHSYAAAPNFPGWFSPFSQTTFSVSAAASNVLTVTGRLVDKNTSSGLSGVTVSKPGGGSVSTDANGAFSFPVNTDEVTASTPKGFAFYPRCYMNRGGRIDRDGGPLEVLVDVFDLVRGYPAPYKILPTGTEADLGAIPEWPATTINFTSDIPVKISISYPEEGQGNGNALFKTAHTLSNVIPLEYPVQVKATDESGREYLSPAATFAPSQGCSPVSLRLTSSASSTASQFEWTGSQVSYDTQSLSDRLALLYKAFAALVALYGAGR